jgi:hypothetical protein
MHSVALVAMGGMLEASSVPGVTLTGIGFTLLCLLLIAVWFVRAGLFVVIHRRLGRSYRSLIKPWRRWAVGPVIAIVTIILLTFDVPLRARFAMSRNDLNRLAQQALAGGPKPLDANGWNAPVQKAGAFNVTVVQVTAAGEVDFRVPGTEFLRSFSGFTYCPTGTPNDPEGSFEPLGGPWYAWHTSW